MAVIPSLRLRLLLGYCSASASPQRLAASPGKHLSSLAPISQCASSMGVPRGEQVPRGRQNTETAMQLGKVSHCRTCQSFLGRG